MNEPCYYSQIGGEKGRVGLSSYFPIKKLELMTFPLLAGVLLTVRRVPVPRIQSWPWYCRLRIHQQKSNNNYFKFY